jgi:hypothetical protein
MLARPSGRGVGKSGRKLSRVFTAYVGSNGRGEGCDMVEFQCCISDASRIEEEHPHNIYNVLPTSYETLSFNNKSHPVIHTVTCTHTHTAKYQLCK